MVADLKNALAIVQRCDSLGAASKPGFGLRRVLRGDPAGWRGRGARHGRRSASLAHDRSQPHQRSDGARPRPGDVRIGAGDRGRDA